MKICIVSEGAGRIIAIVPTAEIKVTGTDAPKNVRILPKEGQTVHVLTLPKELEQIPLPAIAKSFIVKDEQLVPLPGAPSPNQEPRKKN